jgi:hypothetical protein
MRQGVLPFALVILTAVAPSRALAWYNAGHMVSGAIAYDVLKKDSPDTIAKVVALLKKHPDYKARWAERVEGMAEADRDVYLFMLVACWADDVQGQRRYEHPKWHYINLPFKPRGEPDSVRPAKPSEENILTAFKEQYETLKDKCAGEEARSLALRWVCHLVGDAHQPLHTASLFTTNWPEGDRGGNLFSIRVRENSTPIPLHRLWDGLVLGTQGFKTVRNRAIALRNRKELARDRLTELKEKAFKNWVTKESYELATKVAYLDGKLKGGTEQAVAPVLPEGYLQKAKRVGERQIVLAGYRLANLLKKAFE